MRHRSSNVIRQIKCGNMLFFLLQLSFLRFRCFSPRWHFPYILMTLNKTIQWIRLRNMQHILRRWLERTMVNTRRIFRRAATWWTFYFISIYTYDSSKHKLYLLIYFNFRMLQIIATLHTTSLILVFVYFCEHIDLSVSAVIELYLILKSSIRIVWFFE